MKKIILASSSPRRKELMSSLGLKFKVVDAKYRERKYNHLSPAKLVKVLALGKARSVAKYYPKAIIVAADTIVAHKGKIFGKPKSAVAATAMLEKLSATTHDIFTGLAVIDSSANKIFTKVERVKVYFKKLSRQVIHQYVESGEPLDKAGAYAIQGKGKKLVRKIEGDFSAAVGLPVKALGKILKKLYITKNYDRKNL